MNVDAIRRERAAALGGEDKGAVGELAAQLAQGSHLVAAERMAPSVLFLARRTSSIVLRLSSSCDHPADARGPRSINCYLIQVEDFTGSALAAAG
jgi:hypothetical protein